MFLLAVLLFLKKIFFSSAPDSLRLLPVAVWGLSGMLAGSLPVSSWLSMIPAAGDFLLSCALPVQAVRQNIV